MIWLIDAINARIIPKYCKKKLQIGSQPGNGQFENILIGVIVFRHRSFFTGRGDSLDFGCERGKFVNHPGGPAFRAGGFRFIDAGRLQQRELYLAFVTKIFVQGHRFFGLNQLSS
jgi:hypothetical protein